MDLNFFTKEDSELYQTLRSFVLDTWQPEGDNCANVAIKPITKSELLELSETESLSSNDYDFLRADIQDTTIVQYVMTLDIPPALRVKSLGVGKATLDHIARLCGPQFVDMRLNASNSNCLITLIIRSSRVKRGEFDVISGEKSKQLVLASVTRRKLSIRRLLSGVTTSVSTAVVKSLSNYFLGNNYVVDHQNIPEDDQETSTRKGRSPKRSSAGAEQVKDEDGDAYVLGDKDSETPDAKKRKTGEAVPVDQDR